MSKISGRTNQEITIKGTNTKIAIRCPHCSNYIVSEREHFRGWQDTKNVLEARQNAAYFCQECGNPWTEVERVEALKKPIFVAEDQTISKEGIVQGEPPATRTFGFRWNAMHSALKSQAFIGEKEFEAARSATATAAKELMQFTWALPYEEEPEDLSGIDVGAVLAKIINQPRGIIPRGAKYLTFGIDVGIWNLNWTAWAWTEDAQGFLIDYGEFPVPQPDRNNADPRMILTALRALRNEIIDIGWKTADGAKAIPHIVLVDSGYKKEITYAFIQENGSAYMPSKGLGSRRNQDRWHEPRVSRGRQIGRNWYVSRQPGGIRLLNVNVDEWKREIHEGFRILANSAGSLCLYFAESIAHIQFAKQVTAERRIEEYTPGKGTVVRWVEIRKANHYLDCCALCRCAAEILGVSALPKAKLLSVAKKREVVEQVIGERKIRTHY